MPLLRSIPDRRHFGKKCLNIFRRINASSGKRLKDYRKWEKIMVRYTSEKTCKKLPSDQKYRYLHTLSCDCQCAFGRDFDNHGVPISPAVPLQFSPLP